MKTKGQVDGERQVNDGHVDVERQERDMLRKTDGED